MQAPKENTSLPLSEKVSSGVISKICIKNPHVEFFMYHYIRDQDPKDNIFTRELSVSPTIFEIHMKKVADLASKKKIILMN
jgi:hypothetical protein